MSTHEIIMRVAAAIESDHPAEANKLRFCASDVMWLERIVATEVAAAKKKRDA